MMANIRFRSIEGYESFKTKCNFLGVRKSIPVGQEMKSIL